MRASGAIQQIVKTVDKITDDVGKIKDNVVDIACSCSATPSFL
jgi:hypothetical protein